MTTKWRIIAGFVAMIAVAGMVAGIGYRSLSMATSAFTEYRRMAQELNGVMGELVSAESRQ